MKASEKNAKIEQIYHVYGQVLYRYILKIVKDQDLAEEAVQTTFLRIVKYIERIDGIQSEKTKGYLLSIAHHCAEAELRKKIIARNVTEPLDEKILTIRDTKVIEPILDELSFDGEVEKFTSQLKKEEQMLLFLKYGECAKDQEIGTILGINPVAVRQRLSRVKKKLAEMMKAGR